MTKPSQEFQEIIGNCNDRELGYPQELMSPKGSAAREAEIDLLIEAVEESDDVRAAMTLGTLGRVEAEQQVAALLERCSDTTNRVLLGVALFDMMGEGHHLNPQLTASTATLFTINRLKGLSDQESIQKTITCLNAPDKSVRFAAFEALLEQLGLSQDEDRRRLGQAFVLMPLHILKGQVHSSLPSLREPAIERMKLIAATEGWAMSQEELGLVADIIPNEDLNKRLELMVRGEESFSEENLAALPDAVRSGLRLFALNECSPDDRNPAAPRIAALLSRTPDERAETRMVLEATRSASSEKEITQEAAAAILKQMGLWSPPKDPRREAFMRCVDEALALLPG